MKKRLKDTILKILFKLRILGRVHFGIKTVNFIFQRLLLINFKFPIAVHFTTKLNASDRIFFHNDESTLTSFAVSGCCYIQGYNEIYLGENILFAKGLNLISANHSLNSLNSWEKIEPIKIGNNVWIGANVTILPAVVIGNNCIIGAGSVVTKSFPADNLVIAGNPAKIIKYIEEQ